MISPDDLRKSRVSSEPSPPPAAAMNGWGKYISAEVTSLQRQIDWLHEIIRDHETRLREREKSPDDQTLSGQVRMHGWKLVLGGAALLSAKGQSGAWPGSQLLGWLFGIGS